jgi:beta-glucosidase-like glycosyl hydrolase
MAVFTIAILAFADTQCYIFSGQTLGLGEIGSSKQASAGACCDACAALDACISWTFHDTMPAGSSSNCFLKDNVRPEDPPRPVNPHNTTMTGLTSVSQTCDPTSGSICPSGAPCPTNCGAPRCSCHVPESKASPFACLAPHDAYPFCDAALSVEDRVRDLIGRVNASDKPNLLTARGHGSPHKMQAIPALGVPVYYWGTNCLHSMNGGKCVIDSMNRTKCPTNFPSGPSFGATFDRALIQKMANAIGVELRAMFILKLASPSLDCWGPVVNLNRDPRWGRNGEGGTEDGYAMGELAAAWTKGFQAPRPVKGNRTGNSNRELLQGVITLKHMSVNSLENTEPFNRHNFDANRTYGVSPFVLADYYLKPFAAAIGQADARGVMCSYNAVLGKPTCLSPLMRNARKSWGFQGYVTSDSDSVENAFADHHYPANDRGQNATALALTDGQCDIDSGDTYYTNIPLALRNASLNSEFQAADVDRALYNTFKQRFDLGLFDPVDAYDWPTADDVGTDVSQALSLNASREALVLLRNGNPKLTATQPLLPLAKGRKIAVIGPHATAREVMTQVRERVCLLLGAHSAQLRWRYSVHPDSSSSSFKLTFPPGSLCFLSAALPVQTVLRARPNEPACGSTRVHHVTVRCNTKAERRSVAHHHCARLRSL